MANEKDDLVSTLGLTTLDELDPSQPDYISKLEQGYERASRIEKVAGEITNDLRGALLDLTEVTPLNEIDPQNPHIHYFVERGGVVYQACSAEITDLFVHGAPAEVINTQAFLEMERIKPDDLSAKEIEELLSQELGVEEGHINFYAVTHPSNKLSAFELTSKALNDYAQQMESQMPSPIEMIRAIFEDQGYEGVPFSPFSESGDLEPELEDGPESFEPEEPAE